MFVFHFRTFISRKCQLYSICFLRKIQVWGQTYDQIMLVGYVGSWCSEVFLRWDSYFFLRTCHLLCPFLYLQVPITVLTWCWSQCLHSYAFLLSTCPSPEPGTRCTFPRRLRRFVSKNTDRSKLINASFDKTFIVHCTFSIYTARVLSACSRP